MSDIAFGTIDRSRVDEALTMFKRVFNREISKEYYYWQYFDSCFGGGLSKGVWIDGKLVSHIGYTPRDCIINGTSGKALSNHTVMNDPAYRGKGYYARLVSWALQEFAGQGYEMVFTRPNRESHPAQMMQKEYVEIELLPSMTWRGKNTSPRDPADGLIERLERCRMFDDEYQPLIDVTVAGKKYYIQRSPEYYNWRFCRHPMSKYYTFEYREAGRLLSSAVVKLFPQERPTRINIVEWLGAADNRTAGEAVIKSILDIADTYGLEVQMWHNRHDKNRHYWIEKSGFAMDVPVFYFGAYPLASSERLGAFTDFRSWYTAMGDHDIF
ncbi:MAG: GNAT family N-acetyltransferase [bacterium]|nr:GNAT family N-acetyltransferase [bacterium]